MLEVRQLPTATMRCYRAPWPSWTTGASRKTAGADARRATGDLQQAGAPERRYRLLELPAGIARGSGGRSPSRQRRSIDSPSQDRDRDGRLDVGHQFHGAGFGVLRWWDHRHRPGRALDRDERGGEAGQVVSGAPRRGLSRSGQFRQAGERRGSLPATPGGQGPRPRWRHRSHRNRFGPARRRCRRSAGSSSRTSGPVGEFMGAASRWAIVPAGRRRGKPRHRRRAPGERRRYPPPPDGNNGRGGAHTIPGPPGCCPSTTDCRRFADGSDSPRYLERCLADRARAGSGFVVTNPTRRASGRHSAARWADLLGPLDGMPLGVKDLWGRDMPTGMGDLPAGITATASVYALRRQARRATATEFGFSHRGRPQPFVARTPGGSSSGSAAGGGARMVPVAFGSQLMGSVIRPASYCANYGYKPTYGALNRGGGHSSLSQSHLGLHAGSLADAWAVAFETSRLAGGDPGYPGIYGAGADLPRAAPT
jgi:hypothetical protein